MTRYQWGNADHTILVDREQGAHIPWPAVESVGAIAQCWIEAGGVPDPYAPPPPDNCRLAVVALELSDRVATRCVKAGLAYPEAWRAYDAVLRAIVRGDATGPLPERPPYPQGT